MGALLRCRLPGLVLTGLCALCGTTAASAQWRTYPDALVGLDRIPFVVHDLDAASTAWRDMGFTLKEGAAQDNGIFARQLKFEDGAGIDLLAVPAAVDELTTRYRAMLEVAEGPVGFGLYARDLPSLAMAMDGNRRFDYGTVSRTFGARSLDFLFVEQDSRAPGDRAYVQHPNGAKAMSRVWIALANGKVLRDLLVALNADATIAKVYAPEAVQAYDLTLQNGEVLVLPRANELTRGRPVIGATFEVEDLDVVRRRLDLFEIPWSAGGTENMSVVVAPTATHGMWVEFRE